MQGAQEKDPGAASASGSPPGGSWRDVTLSRYRRYTMVSSVVGVLLLAWGMLRMVQTQVLSGLVLVVLGFVVGLWTLSLRIEGAPAVLQEGRRPVDREQWKPRAVHFYTRKECTLCDEARYRLEPVLAEKGITLVVHDVDKDAVLRQRYGTRVPVAVYEGEELFALQYDEASVRVIR